MTRRTTIKFNVVLTICFLYTNIVCVSVNGGEEFFSPTIFRLGLDTAIQKQDKETRQRELRKLAHKVQNTLENPRLPKDNQEGFRGLLADIKRAYGPTSFPFRNTPLQEWLTVLPARLDDPAQRNPAITGISELFSLDQDLFKTLPELSFPQAAQQLTSILQRLEANKIEGDTNLQDAISESVSLVKSRRSHFKQKISPDTFPYARLAVSAANEGRIDSLFLLDPDSSPLARTYNSGNLTPDDVGKIIDQVGSDSLLTEEGRANIQKFAQTIDETKKSQASASDRNLSALVVRPGMNLARLYEISKNAEIMKQEGLSEKTRFSELANAFWAANNASLNFDQLLDGLTTLNEALRYRPNSRSTTMLFGSFWNRALDTLEGSPEQRLDRAIRLGTIVLENVVNYDHTPPSTRYVSDVMKRISEKARLKQDSIAKAVLLKKAFDRANFERFQNLAKPDFEARFASLKQVAIEANQILALEGQDAKKKTPLYDPIDLDKLTYDPEMRNAICDFGVVNQLGR